MKKLLLSAILGLAAVTITPALSQAGTFGLFTGCSWFGHCGCSKCEFTVRPYNAFTPVCSGNITCMGCMPFSPMPNYSGFSCPAQGQGYGACQTPGYCQGQGAGQEIIGESIGETQTLPLPSIPQLTQPAPVQQNVTLPGTTSKAPNLFGAIQAGYHPAYAPTYNPYQYYNYYAPMGQTPYYWNAK